MTLNEAFEHEKQAALALNNLKTSLRERIASSEPMDGVTVIPGKCNMVVINLETLQRERNLNPDTYIQGAQADAVERVLTPRRGIADTVLAIRDMIAHGYACYSAGEKKIKTTLNRQTLSILKEAIGDFHTEVA